MKIMRRFCAVLLLAAVLLPLSGCVSDRRFGRAELNRRLRNADPALCFDESAMFFARGVYYGYLSLSAEEDTLLTLKEDETGYLDRITLTRAAPYGEQGSAAFRDHALALASVFVPEADLPRLARETGLDDPAVLRADWLRCSEQGPAYRAYLFGTDVSVSFILEYLA